MQEMGQKLHICNRQKGRENNNEKNYLQCFVEIECIASDSENIAPSRGEVVIRELA